MYRALFTASFALVAFSAIGQSPEWWVAPDTLLAVELPLDSTISVAQIDYGDLAAEDSVVWAWKRVAWDVPEGWQADLCDPSVCHTGVPSSSVQLLLPPQSPSFLKLLISSRGIPGEGSGTFWVFPEGQIQHHLTLHFTFTSGPTSVTAASIDAVTGPYPNPTTGSVKWHGPVPDSGAWHLLTADGTLWQSGQFPTLPDLTSASPGLYLFRPASPKFPTTPLVKH